MAPISLVAAPQDSTVSVSPLSNSEKNPSTMPYIGGCTIARKDVAVENLDFEKNPSTMPYIGGCIVA
jgi:hypothetical protein